VLRNPKDQLVSMYNFLRSFPSAKMEPFKSMLLSGWDKFFEHIVAGKSISIQCSAFIFSLLLALIQIKKQS